MTRVSDRVPAMMRRLRADTSALALLEFAFTLPIILAMGGYGIEISNLALANLDVSQYALTLADNASRVGVDSGLSSFQLREADINDILEGTRQQSKNLNLTTYGRVTLSSLENTKWAYDSGYVQRIHWQRCIGLRSAAGYPSSYGTTLPADGTDSSQANDGTPVPSGMGDPPVSAPPDAGVMFVEVNYDYQPLFSTMFVAPTKIHYVASFIVRDKRDYAQIYPSTVGTPSKCDKFTA